MEHSEQKAGGKGNCKPRHLSLLHFSFMAAQTVKISDMAPYGESPRPESVQMTTGEEAMIELSNRPWNDVVAPNLSGSTTTDVGTEERGQSVCGKKRLQSALGTKYNA